MFSRHSKKIPPRHIPASSRPTQLYIELSTFCNLACKTCVRNSVIDFKAEHFAPELMDCLIDGLAQTPTLERIVLLGYGEALCNPHIHTILKQLGDTGIPLCLVTNGQLMSPELVDLLIGLPVQEVFLSWDDYDAADQIRLGADTDKILTAIANLRRLRRGDYPRIGIEIVALRHNQDVLQKIVAASAAAGGEKIIVTNVFPYVEAMRSQILFTDMKRPDFNLLSNLDTRDRPLDLIIAKHTIDETRVCPFLEKGTLFVTAKGDIAPCLELAHTHTAWYFNGFRTHYQVYFGNIMQSSLNDVWDSGDFKSFRKFCTSYDFPNCLVCPGIDFCRFRTTQHGDCFHSGLPCGECLWARGVICCP